MACPDFPENDDLDALIDAPARAEPVHPPASYNPAGFQEECRRCGGTGKYRGFGACFDCGGTGKGRRTFKTSPEKRAGAQASKARRTVAQGAENLQAFAAAQPEVWAWMDGATYHFAVSLRQAVEKYGHLTDRQLAAAHNAMGGLARKKLETELRRADTRDVNTAALEAAFAKAGGVLKRPKFRVGELVISRAKAESRNPGALYVKQQGGRYLGKIDGGKFARSADCTTEQAGDIVEILADPVAAAIGHGRLTGNCACCGRKLTDPESVERGIGPICAEAWGF